MTKSWITDEGHLVTEGLFCGQPFFSICDRLCEKAWGINSRPKEEFDEDEPDDCQFLTDDELGEAPRNPGTYEGRDGKPFHPLVHNKWCVRECERSAMTRTSQDLIAPTFEVRRHNMPSRHND